MLEPLQRIGIPAEILTTVLDNVGAYVYIKDTEGRYIYVNRQVQELFGASLEEIVGQTDEAFFDLERSAELRENDRHVMESGQVHETEEVNYLKSTGERLTYLTVKQPLYDDSQKLIGMFGISTDITERKALERELKHQNEMLNIVMDNIDSSIFMLDEDNRLVYSNRCLAEQFQHTQAELKNMKISELVDEATFKSLAEHNRKVFESGQAQKFREDVITADGGRRIYWSVKVPHTMANDERIIIGLSTDMTETFLLQERLREQSNRDPMTGLYNRRFFFDFAEKNMAESERSGRPTATLIIDVDDFKNINDAHGHPAGDHVLKVFSAQLEKLIRKGDIAARVGGEEFAVLLPNTGHKQAVSGCSPSYM
ncbi:diguanylate cyclase [Aliidiomarina halalkaliphila]|uniref:Diguanylate cyclase n=1 Tax=Aliidiomarina halalkaliphila TaxID=2593535 RepID=A0A552X054_9GAMM|nr:diguanylate cyclase [Aliidiomarina halalkaliphila]TRW48394.1 diguanylate cyclase [Aliidiomarina halalkaliphila]